MTINPDQIKSITDKLNLLVGTVKLYSRMLDGLSKTLEVVIESLKDLEED